MTQPLPPGLGPQQPAQPPPIDIGNQLLSEGPAQLTCSLVPTPAGQRMALTIRTSSATVTVLLSQDDARNWGRNVLATANQMSKSGLVVAGSGAVPHA